MGINRFREEHSQQDWVWVMEWWKLRHQRLEAAMKKKH
jgi:hypothetical protein